MPSKLISVADWITLQNLVVQIAIKENLYCKGNVFYNFTNDDLRKINIK